MVALSGGGAGASTGTRRGALLDAAAERFSAVGIAKTTMEDIAREAGAGKATLYRHFPNKAAVLDALLERENRRLARVVEGAVARQRTTPCRIEAAFVAALGFLRSHALLNKGLREEPDVVLPYLTSWSAPLLRSCMTLFTDMIRKGVEAGELRPVDPEWAAETLFRLLLSFFTLPQLTLRLDDPEEVRAYVRGILAGALVR
jgi:AcrR family transcriptional regulator